MGILNGMETRASLEDPRVPLASADAFSILFGEGFASASGVEVTTDKAMGVPAFWAGVNFIGNTMASLPLQLFRTSGEDSDLLKSDPLYGLLHDVVNEDRLTSYKWRKLMMTSALTEGRGLTYIERNRAMRPANLWPLDPSTVTIRKADHRTFYDVKDAGRTITYEAQEIIDVPFILAKDGISARAPVATLKNALGLAISLEAYAARFFQNGGVPPLVLHGPQASAGAVRRATATFDDAVKRAQQENKSVLYAPLGHELKPVGINPEQGQLVQARLFQLQEIARVLSLSPVFLHDLSHGTFTNTEQQDLHVTKHTMTHWVKLWEQELNAKLFPPGSRGRFIEFNMDGLLRGDFKTRMEGMATAVQNGIRTPNELRGKDNLRAMPGGDRLYIQGATVPLAGQDSPGEGGEGETGNGEE